MKKQYRIITLVINLLLLVLFVVLEGVYTYETATKIMNENWQEVMNLEEKYIRDTQKEPDEFKTISKRNIIPLLYRDFKDMSRYKSDDIGCYEVYICDDGKKIEPVNHIEVCFDLVIDLLYDLNQGGAFSRFIPVGPDFKFRNKDSWGNVKIDAMYDDNFIFNGTIEGIGRDCDDLEYTIGENDLADTKNAVRISEWPAYNIDAEYIAIADTEYEAELCDEAKKKLEETLSKIEKDSIIKEYSNGEYYYYSCEYLTDENVLLSISYSKRPSDDKKVVALAQKELGTSFYIGKSFYICDDAINNTYAIYIFHPLEITFRNNIKKYITSLIAFILLEIFVVIVMRKLCSNRMKYELMRRDLTRSIAHDLKTPLAITKAYTENWEYIDEKDRHRYAERLHSEIDNMASIINNMINMSKFDSKQDLKLEKVELRSMVSEILERMKPIISERELDVRFFTDKDDEMYSVLADPKMIRIAINNFITNAVKYAESCINIDLYSYDKKIKFVIGNDGKTISKKDIKKIWEPFYKGDKARTDRIGSSGMGLAINSSILRLHKAKHKCTSKNGRTTFWFEIKRMDKNGK